MRKTSLLILAGLFSLQVQAQDAKMDAFINKLMGQMTIDEKIGQLNLVTPGGFTEP